MTGLKTLRKLQTNTALPLVRTIAKLHIKRQTKPVNRLFTTLFVNELPNLGVNRLAVEWESPARKN